MRSGLDFGNGSDYWALFVDLLLLSVVLLPDRSPKPVPILRRISVDYERTPLRIFLIGRC